MSTYNKPYKKFLKSVIRDLECENPNFCVNCRCGIDYVSVQGIHVLTAGILCTSSGDKGGAELERLWERALDATADLHRYLTDSLRECDNLVEEIEHGALALFLSEDPSDFLDSLKPKRNELEARRDAVRELYRALLLTSCNDRMIVAHLL